MPLLSISGYSIVPSINKSSVVYDGLTIPPDSVLFFDKGQHNGANAVPTLVDSTKVWPTNEFTGFRLRNTSDGSETSLGSPIVSSTVTTVASTLAGGNDNNWDINDYYEIVLNIDANDIIHFDARTDLGGIITMSTKGVPRIIGINAAHTFEVWIEDITDSSISNKYSVIIGANDSVIYDGLTIPPDSVLFFDKGQHTGANNVSVLADSTKTWSTNEFTGFRIRNTSDGSETTFSTPAISNTNNTITATLVGGTDADWDTDDYYEVVLNLDSSDIIYFEKFTNLGGKVTMTTKGVPSIVGERGVHTFSVWIQDITDSSISNRYLVTITTV